MNDRPAATDWVLFGEGNYLSDIFDIIHQTGGHVKKIVRNMEVEPQPRTKRLRDHLKVMDDPPAVQWLEEFRPEEGERYNLGCTVPGRRRLVETLRGRFGLKFDRLVHPTAYLGGHVELGEGVLIGPGATVGPHTVLEEFSFINRSASIGHDARLGPYARVAPNATLAGFARLGAGSMVAAGATVLDRVYIGENSIVGAGAVATKDIPDGVIALGIPARVIRKNG